MEVLDSTDDNDGGVYWHILQFSFGKRKSLIESSFIRGDKSDILSDVKNVTISLSFNFTN